MRPSTLTARACNVHLRHAVTVPLLPAVLARDPQSVVFYDSKGQFVGVRRPGSGKAIQVEGLQLVVEGVVGATGLELKNDPGVPAVYAGAPRGWAPDVSTQLSTKP